MVGSLSAAGALSACGDDAYGGDGGDDHQQPQRVDLRSDLSKHPERPASA